ncbi:MAG: hypothetical protein KatS3mg111_2049 [Pirellulaceae bacterium]|nr:MAG: hypothetical protein KatS3mg111_2049 [Pirellulaceae bacterium]
MARRSPNRQKSKDGRATPSPVDVVAPGEQNQVSVIDAKLVDSPAPPASPADEIGMCSACGMPYRAADTHCRACGQSLASGSRSPVTPLDRGESAHRHAFQCENCGSVVSTSVDRRSYVCPFCDSTYVVEISAEVSGRQRPEFIIGFAITKEQAVEKFHQWLGRNSWFCPKDLRVRAVTQRQQGVYLPFWHFTALAHSSWTARIGEYWYRTETYTTTNSKGEQVTRTRQVRETEWYRLAGEFERFHWGVLVPGTQSITAEEAKSLQPFRLGELQRYDPAIIAGWLSEEYSIPLSTARQAAWGEVEQRQQAGVAAFLPGDTHRDLTVTTRVEQTGTDLVLFPVYVFSYRYRNTVHRFLVNGQTGKVTGTKPVSWPRVALAVVVVLVLLALLLALILWTGQR